MEDLAIVKSSICAFGNLKCRSRGYLDANYWDYIWRITGDKVTNLR